MDMIEGAGGAAAQDEQALTRMAANETTFGVYITDAVGRIIYINQTFSRMLGHSAADVMGRPAREVLPSPHHTEGDFRRFRQSLMAGRDVCQEVRTIDKAGNDVWLTVTLRPFLNPDGSLRQFMGILEDTREIGQIQGLQRDVLEIVARDVPLHEVMTFICNRVEEIFPEVTSTVLSVDREGRVWPLAGPSLPAIFAESVAGAQIGPKAGSCGTAAWRGEAVTVEDIATDPLWEDYRGLALPLGLRACWSSPIKLRDGRVAGTFAFYFRENRGPSIWHERVVSACVHLCCLAFERNEAKAHIDKLAYYDTLTGLPNRSMLQRELEAAFAAAPEQARALLFLDVDRFKDVNDTLGHSVGDELLVEVAERLQKQVGPGDIVCRHGGDEFVIVLANGAPDNAAHMAEKILSALLEPTRVIGLALPVTASVGISLYPRDGRDTDMLLKTADTAMYQAKAGGRARHQFFSPEMNQMAQDRLLLSVALREAIAEGTLELHYQPQISAHDGTLLGVEALARWTHPTLGAIAPDRFVRLAEETGQIQAIGDWALNEGCRQLKAWDRMGLEVPTVSVNVSPLHFRTCDLLGAVKGALEMHGLEPERLAVEITEGVAMDDSPIAMENARALHRMGVRLSMDDFGTGYSSLSHLSKLPVDELKIDRSFMQGLEEHNCRTLVTAVIRIGQSLGLRVVAEGVETDAQRRFLQALDCDVLQGFLISRPLPASALEDWVGNYTAKLDVRGAA